MRWGRVHEGLSFNDCSGDRLRDRLGIGHENFYDDRRTAVKRMGLLLPGRDPRGGDRPKACPHALALRLRPHFETLGLTLLIGSRAIRGYLPVARGEPLCVVLRC